MLSSTSAYGSLDELHIMQMGKRLSKEFISLMSNFSIANRYTDIL